METWVDPTSNEQPTVEQPEENSAGIATNPSPPPPPSIENQKTSETPTTAPKPVICKKGKCQPYDPAKDRVSIILFQNGKIGLDMMQRNDCNVHSKLIVK